MTSDIRKNFNRAERKWAKYDPYFEVYGMVASYLLPTDNVVEIGVANGGSAEAWASFLGGSERYVGVDLNPNISKLEHDLGVRCVIGDSTDHSTWERISRLGKAGIVIDDGGHTNAQQVASLRFAPLVLRPGGWLVIEDMHASFLRSFGNPRPTRTSRIIASLVEDHCRVNAGRSPKYKKLWDSYDMVLAAPSIVALRTANGASFGEVFGGSDGSLMDHDWRWGSPKSTSSFLGRIAHRIGPRLHDELVVRRMLRKLK